MFDRIIYVEMMHFSSVKFEFTAQIVAELEGERNCHEDWRHGVSPH
jgi:hypothetical protein